METIKNGLKLEITIVDRDKLEVYIHKNTESSEQLRNFHAKYATDYIDKVMIQAVEDVSHALARMYDGISIGLTKINKGGKDV